MDNFRFDRQRRGARGMTLAEILVAMTVFVIAAAVALILYNALSKSYKRGDNASDVQQNTRLAFDNMVTEARMAGFNYNPDGSEDRPDEQLEGAWDTAMTFRGDFDFDDPTASQTPEATLSGGSEVVVSTGNDEIITYALAKPDGTGGQDLTFVADVQGVPRNGTLETVTISNVALVQDDPPYTLYRISVNPDSTNVTRTPVADNIYSLRFRYFDSGADELGPGTPDDPSDDIGGLDSPSIKALRESVRRIELSVVGMTPDPDLDYTDPDDPYPDTEKHRKFRLVQDVTPRNIGYVGRPDIDIVPPGQPVNMTACPGQCGGALLEWDAAPATDLVKQYVAVRGTTVSALGAPVTSPTNKVYMKNLTEGESYYFRVRAEDLSGNISPMSNLATPGPADVGDTTTPSVVPTFETSGGSTWPTAENDYIRVRWGPVTTNEEDVGCQDEPSKIYDLAGYRIYRGPDDDDATMDLYIMEDETSAQASEYKDSNVVACRTYWYDIAAVDDCGNEGARQSVNLDADATTEFVPARPLGLQADDTGPSTVALQWARVAQNTNGDTILVDTYRVYKAELPSGLTPEEAKNAIDWETEAVGTDVAVSDTSAPAWVDVNAYLADTAANALYYRVAGLTDCNDPYDEGVLSAVRVGTSCDLGGTISLTPAHGDTVSGSTNIGVAVAGADPAEAFTGSVVVSNSSGVVVAQYGTGTTSGQPLPFYATWDTAALPPGDYVITATVTNASGCSKFRSHTVAVTPPSPCCLAPLSPAIGPLRGKVSERQSDVSVLLTNHCAQDLSVTRFDMSWTNIVNTQRQEHFCFEFATAEQPEGCIDEADFVVDFVPPQISPVSLTFGTPLFFGATRDDFDPLAVGFQYDLSLVDSSRDLGETLTLRFWYETTGSTQAASCLFQIDTNPLNVTVIDE